MSVTLTPPTRVAGLIGVVVLGLAAIMLVVGRGLLGGDQTGAAVTPTAVTKPAARAAAAPKPAATQRPRPRVSSGFPAKIDHALRYSRVVVVSVSMPGGAVDAIVRREARAAAKATRAGFVAISATNERAVSGLVAKTGVLHAPAVVIVRRPGVVTTTFSVTDAGTVAQAVAQARR
jgi:hypothetical protein